MYSLLKYINPGNVAPVKHLLFSLLLLCIIAISLPVAAGFTGGNGSVENPWQIANLQELNDTRNYPDNHFVLIANIDATDTQNWNDGAGWQPIGNWTSPFTGTFDGKGHVIDNLYIDRNTDKVGLFGHIDAATVQNIGIVNADITGHRWVGGLVGSARSSSLIQNCYSTGDIRGTYNMIGGIAGVQDSSQIINSYSCANVSSTYHEYNYVGGLLGSNYNQASVINSYSTGEVTGADSIGGLIGVTSTDATTMASYWDVNTSNLTTSAGGEGKTTEQMQQQSTFVGWDFTNTWLIEADEYPKFQYTRFAGGDGSETNPYKVSTLNHLKNINYNLAAHYVQISDLDATDTQNWNDGAGWQPIGNKENRFTGTFDGSNYTITDLYIYRPATRYVGLFGYAYKANIKNIGLENVNITGGDDTGAVAGYSYYGGVIGNSYSTGNVNGQKYVGGIAGSTSAHIVNSYSTCGVDGNTGVGGLCGMSGTNGVIHNSYSTGEVNGTDYLGGLVGQNHGSIFNSYYNTETSGQNDTDKGVPKTTDEMKNISTFSAWDINAIDNYLNDGYPFLAWQDDRDDYVWLISKPLFCEGDGTVDEPYLICDAYQLNNTRYNLSAHYRLGNDIDLTSYNTGKGWQPIGTPYFEFNGTFDGQDYTISNLTINRSNEDFVGLFGCVENGTIKNVVLDNVNVTGSNWVAAVAGAQTVRTSATSPETIENVTVSGNVAGQGYVGGIVGMLQNERILNSVSHVEVTGEYHNIGGLVGQSVNSTVQNSRATGDVIAPGASRVGGLIGSNSAEHLSRTVRESYATGNVTGYNYVGGLIGKNRDDPVIGSHATGDVRGYSHVGGLVGYNNGGIIENSSAAGDVRYEAQEYAPTSNEIKSPIDPSYFGGLIGYSNQGTINTSHASGDVIAPNTDRVGGLVGYNTAAEFHTVRQSNATGNVTGYRYVGGLIGQNSDDLITESSARGDVHGQTYVGGLVGYNHLGTIERCDAAGEVFQELLVVPGPLRTESLTDNEVTYSIAGFSDRENGLQSPENTVLREKIYYPGTTGGLAGMNKGGQIIDSHATGDVVINTDRNVILQGIGGFAGYNEDGTINNSYSTGNIVFARSYQQIPIMGLGGFVGFNDNGKIQDSHSTGDIINENNLNGTLIFYMGGLVGVHDGGYINDSYSQGEIHFGNITGKSTIMGCAGLVGAHDGAIIRSHSTGDVVIEGNITEGTITSVGGLLGADYGGEINQSYTTGDVTVNTGSNGTVTYIGGLVGLNQGALDSSYATGDVLAQGDYLGGLVGLNDGSVNNTYSRGDVTGNSSVGGFIGQNHGNVSNSYSTGYVTAEYSEYLGGFIGQHTSGNITNSYWYKIDDSMITGVGNQSDVQGVFGRSAQQMQSQSTFSGWDFANIWYIHPTINDGYPQLQVFINEYPAAENKEKTTTSTSRTSVGPSHSPENVDSTDSAINKVLAGSSVRYDFSKSQGPVMGIGFKTKDNKGNVVAKVQVLKDKPDDVDEPSGNSYRILSLSVGSEGTINEDNADNILIEFRVSKEWIEENNIDPSTIRMTRFNNGEWQDLPGSQVRKDEQYLYFNAETPGFSVFSIVGEEYKEVIEEPIAQEPEAEQQTEEDQTSEAESAQAPGFTGLFALALFAGAALIMRKK
ncbi:GLUG motif-containing protein [Methanohalophilus halophilus]|nr:GLUG motif-containing protein [Methanohalophilus halophilus]APH38565.1 hypothetical protein BHR79_03055 [Methanohalophilus halophilus]SDW14718.1 PGF-pre-PGF domain-containing protein [Methanohalophilus halophilus]